MGAVLLSPRDEASLLADELLTDLELERLSINAAVKKASRLARLLNDLDATTWLSWELGGIPGSDAGKQHMTKTARWTDKDEGKGWWGPVADAETAVEAYAEQMRAAKVDSLSGEYLNTALDRTHRLQAAINQAMRQQQRIVTRVAAMLYEYVHSAYYELKFGDHQQELFETARSEIDGRLGAMDDGMTKVEAVYARLRDGDPEAVSAAMNSCRRLMDRFADSVYPPQPEPIERNGRQIDLGANKTQNRINEYVHERTASNSRRKRIRRALSDIYDRVSTGVHKDVTHEEARYLFLATYTLLGEILSLESASGSGE